jgi:hypothetical protein
MTFFCFSAKTKWIAKVCRNSKRRRRLVKQYRNKSDATDRKKKNSHSFLLYVKLHAAQMLSFDAYKWCLLLRILSICYNMNVCSICILEPMYVFVVWYFGGCGRILKLICCLGICEAWEIWNNKQKPFYVTYLTVIKQNVFNWMFIKSISIYI